MVDTSTLAGVLRASQSPVSRRQPRPTPQPVAPTQSLNQAYQQMEAGFADNPILKTLNNAVMFIPNQLGAAHRDAYSELRGTSTPTQRNVFGQPNRAYGDDTNQWDELGLDINRREGLTGPVATATRVGTNTAGVIASLLGDGAIGSLATGIARNAPLITPRVVPAFQTPEVRQAALMRSILQDPDTYAVTTRSTNSLEDILNTGRFQSSRQTGRTGSGMFDSVDEYNPLRQKAETAVWGPKIDNVQYGQLVNDVLKSQPRPFPIGESGRKALQEYLLTARSFDPRQSLSYGMGRGASNRPDPVQYVWSPDALKRSQLYYDDSMFSQATTPERLTKSFDEFLGSFAGKGQGANWVTRRDLTKQIKDTNKKYGLDIDLPAKDWYSNRTPGGYIEAQLPNLTLDDIARIDAVSGPRNSLEAIQQALEASGRSIPTGIANVLDDSFYKMPALASKKVRADLEALFRRLQDNFNPRRRSSGGQTLDPFDDLDTL